MLGRLARHLLHAGYDCLYKKSIDDQDLIRIAHESDRVILTRDHDLVGRFRERKKVYVMENEDLKDQLSSLQNAFHVTFDPDRFFTRCSHCNVSLTSVEKETVSNEVPDETANWIEDFYRCPQCRRVYWKGSHYRDLIDKFGEWNLLKGD